MYKRCIDTLINLQLPSKRVYDIACGICKIKGYNNLDEFVSDIFLDRIQMYPDGRAELDNELHSGFKTRLEERAEAK